LGERKKGTEMSAKVGQVYAFPYSDHEVKNLILPLLVVDVTKEHVYYIFPDTDKLHENGCHIYPMYKKAWNKNYDGRVLIGQVKIPANS
jgi:hypothetical protein